MEISRDQEMTPSEARTEYHELYEILDREKSRSREISETRENNRGGLPAK